MRSPFPGMDPYLERHWQDMHGSLIYLAKAALQEQLGDDLVARSEERLIIEHPQYRPRSTYPDIRVVKHGQSGVPVAPSGGVAVAEPPMRQRFIEIIDVSTGGRVVTVVEFLSPVNKRPGDGREQYRRKQQECIEGRINLVEIDLIRQGDWETLVSPWELPTEQRKTYLACVYRANWNDWGRKEAYPMSLRSRLPAIRVPLRKDDLDILLDLQPLIDETYRTGRYDRTIDYTGECDPPLEGDDASWAEMLLKSAGRR